MTKKMNQEIKKRWVEALRSGEYQQGTDLLRDSKNKFCCLGVLCDLTKGTLGLEWDNCGYGFMIDDETTVLPTVVSQYTNISRHGDYEDNGNHSLTHMNDNGYTFTELADIIEKNL